jgi:adenine/guanine phosphoribosyltransferase-like PRPP-binding protein
MKSKIIYHGIEELQYPVGTYIYQNIPKIKLMVAEVMKVKALITKLKDNGANIICRGSSGAIIATIFATEMVGINTQIIHIKKDGESAHSGGDNIIRDGVNIIVDDFICTGETMTAIYTRFKRITSLGIIDAVCVTGKAKNLSFTPKYYFATELY